MSTQALSMVPLPPRALVTRGILRDALVESFVKLLPQYQWRNPVMFVVYLGSMLTTILWVQALTGKGEAPAGFILAVTLWLWFTVLFANFAEAVAEGRSKAQAAALRAVKRVGFARKLKEARPDAEAVWTPSADLRKGDLFAAFAEIVVAGDVALQLRTRVKVSFVAGLRGRTPNFRFRRPSDVSRIDRDI